MGENLKIKKNLFVRDITRFSFFAYTYIDLFVDLFYSDFMSAHRTRHTHIHYIRMMITPRLIIVVAVFFGMTSPALFTKGMFTLRRYLIFNFFPR